ncbi:glycosyltransferase [Nodosilinea sp. AN01ver1]|uniref:glycosyltransferase n=1 Tax=Nodosilinea sp. AN01ver1 TaxID=3423362 RepID=UPI003D3106A3
MAVPTVTTSDTGPKVYPTVSVIVPVYNGEADLPELLERLLGQQYPADRVEYLLVDNGSRDRTPDLLKAATATAAAQGIRLRALTSSTIQSSYAARNAGIAAATADILAFTDADCQPEPGWLPALVQPFADNSVGLVAGEIKALPSQNWLERYADRQGTLSQQNTLNHSFLPYGQTANLAVRAKILGTVGLFRPHLTTGGDADLCWRIQQETSWQLVHAADAVVYHRHRDTLKGLHSQWYRYGCSNRYLHDLHGVELMRPLTAREIRYRLLRWGLKELPQASVKFLSRHGTALELAITPLDLWCAQARTQGQAQAVLPAAARMISRLGEPS